MTKRALSLGYPHPDLMLSQMTASQFMEMDIFFRTEEEEKECLQEEANEAKLMQYFARAVAQQNKNNG